MAPKTRGVSGGATGMKRKRAARRPVRHSSPESSDTPTPPASPAHSSAQVDPLAGRVIVMGRKMDFELFEAEGFLVGRQILEMGWEVICSLECPTYPSLVKDFYKNLTRGDNGLVSTVRNVRVNVSVSSLSKLLSLPTSGPASFNPEDRCPALSRILHREIEEFEEILANQLSLELRLLHNICSRILFPKSGRFDYVSERDVFIMDAVISGKPINLPSMIIWYMADCASKKRACLPYGMIITRILQSQGVVISDSEPQRRLRHTDYYSLATIHRMGFIKKNGHWERKNQSEERAADADAPGPSTRRPSPAHHDSVPAPAPASPAELSTPVPAPTFTSPSVTFSDAQLDQLKTLLNAQKEELFAEFENKRNEDINKIRDEVSNFKEEIIARLDVISFSLNDSVKTFSAELHKIFEHLDNVTDGSGKYVHATTQLRKDIELAVAQIANSINDLKKLQKEDIMEMIGHLKQIVFKHT